MVVREFFSYTLAIPNKINASQTELISKDLAKVLENQLPLKMELESTLKLFPVNIVASVKLTEEIKQFQSKIIDIMKKYAEKLSSALMLFQLTLL